MPVKRTYRCTTCEGQWTVLHHGRDEPYPACPQGCDAPETETAWVPQGFAIKTNLSRAIDYTQSMAESQYGLTDMNDNQRAGDIAAPPVRPPTRQDTEALTQMMAEAHRAAHETAAPLPPEIPLQSFWSQAGGSPLTGAGGSAPGAAEARASGVDAVSLIEGAKATGSGGMKLQVVARGNGE